ncbi:MAG: hypothetical protein K0S72_1826 [Arthrobacter sp.]|nr:hypothetical protein [Arthrobacter sp.]
MEPSAFDTLVRSLATVRTRRRLVILLAALPLGSVLTTLSEDEAAAQHPIDRVQQRTPQAAQQQELSGTTKVMDQGGSGPDEARRPVLPRWLAITHRDLVQNFCQTA